MHCFVVKSLELATAPTDNYTFMNLWMALVHHRRVENGTTSTIDLRQKVDIKDANKWKIAYCLPPNNNVLMIQTPAIDHDEETQLDKGFKMLETTAG